MPSPLTQAGALTAPSGHAALYTNRWMTGLWTNRNQLRDAATPYLYEKFYSASHFDSLLGGVNAELTPGETLARRAGHSVYNSQSFVNVNRFYSFRSFSTTTEQIRVMVDTAAAVYDGTGPSRQLNIWNKATGAADSLFQSVGDDLFWGDGVSQKQWIQSSMQWAPSTVFNAGDMIVDTNNNLQVVLPPSTANIASVEIISAFGLGNIYVTFKSQNPFYIGSSILLQGLTTFTGLNGRIFTVNAVGNNQIGARTTLASYPLTSDTGTATGENTGSGTSGSSVTWATGIGQITLDNTLAWVNKGSSVQNWGIAAPTQAPTLNQAVLPFIYPAWSASTTYLTALLIVDTNNNIQALTTGGTTGSTQPTWSTATGATTADGTAVWTNQGAAGWNANTAYAVGAKIAVSFTYYVTVTTTSNTRQYGGSPTTTTSQYPVTAHDYFECVVAGTSGATQPAWVDGTGSQVSDNTVTWSNVGQYQTWTSAIGGVKTVSLDQTVLDSNGFLQKLLSGGISGTTSPTWSQTPGAITTESTGVTWTNGGPYATAFLFPVFYSFAYTSSTTNHTSTTSPLSASILKAANMRVNMQGSGSTDPQVDTITVYRTVQGGSIQLYIDQFPAPPNGAAWTYTDTSADADLDELLPAAINETNSPAPAGFRPLAYHLGCIFGAVGNTLSWTNNTQQTGNPNMSFTPSNYFVLPAKITYAWPCTIGLIVFTVSDVYLVTGTNTTSDPLVISLYIQGTGLLSYDAITINLTTPYMMNSVGQLIALDPSSGIIEPGFPIADQLYALYDPSNAQLTWHQTGLGDTAFFIADQNSSWFRLSSISAPDSGMVWSPRATLAGSTFKTMRSIETSPGQKQLLLGPGSTPGPILYRDVTKNTDNGTTFPCNAIIGSIVLAQPGQIAELDFFTLESTLVGTRPTIGVLLGEINGAKAGGPSFEVLTRSRQDPPKLPPSKTLYSDRYDMRQNQNTVFCRHLQMNLAWVAEDAHNELLTYTIFGSLHNEKNNK